MYENRDSSSIALVSPSAPTLPNRAPCMQSASANAALLYRVIGDLAAPGADGCLLDLYSGVGTVALTLAGRCKAAVCVDNCRQNVSDGRVNAAALGAANCDFVRGAAEANILQVLQRKEVMHAKDLVAVINPPRGGVPPQCSAAGHDLIEQFTLIRC